MKKSSPLSALSQGLMPEEHNEMPTLITFRNSVYGKAEEQYLKTLMAVSKGYMKKAMAISGLSQSRLYALLQKYDLLKTKKNR